MAKKKHAEHVNHERWLVSYADLLTLLFAFFVVLFASSVSDKKKTAAMAAAMQSAFSDNGAFDAHAKTPPLEPGAGNSQGAPAPLMMPLPNAPDSGVGGAHASPKAVEAAVQKAVAGDALQGSASVRSDGSGTTVSLSDAGLFASGSADLSPAAKLLLRKIAATLPDRELRVEGHTDDQPIHSERFRSNFELSTARAAAVAEALMQASRIAPSRFTLAGYGEFHPAASNSTVEGRAKNRRVDIVVTGDVGTPRSASADARGPHTTMVPVAAAPSPHAATGSTLAEQLAPAADRAAAR
ncbi:flagellar motor protein MotB [Terriglobus aquaticus]|uniref:Flagellar motor protein MotB n=1 Tax=Terriglobus aquaticus TaxID=940139 RepID=A0ABW9KNM1_9BACT|nr:flagellar motor protein MotB [Terriglobus aquaticus]